MQKSKGMQLFKSRPFLHPECGAMKVSGDFRIVAIQRLFDESNKRGSVMRASGILMGDILSLVGEDSLPQEPQPIGMAGLGRGIVRRAPVRIRPPHLENLALS